MYTLLMKGNEIFRTTSPEKMTCELLGKNQRVHFKNNVRVLQTQRAKQKLKKSKIFSLIVGVARVGLDATLLWWSGFTLHHASVHTDTVQISEGKSKIDWKPSAEGKIPQSFCTCPGSTHSTCKSCRAAVSRDQAVCCGREHVN